MSRSAFRIRIDVAQILCFFSLVWIVLAVIMYRFGVGVMGTAGVSLPYNLSGILFYSRTILMPLILLFCMQEAIKARSRPLLYLALISMCALAFSEVLVRASKSPLILIGIYFWVLITMMRMQNVRPFVIDKKAIVGIFSFGVILFPIITLYRTLAVSGVDFSFATVMTVAQLLSENNVDTMNLIQTAFNHFVHRFVGFTQFAGLVAIEVPSMDAANVISVGIAKYYTAEILGYTFEGHLSAHHSRDLLDFGW